MEYIRVFCEIMLFISHLIDKELLLKKLQIEVLIQK